MCQNISLLKPRLKPTNINSVEAEIGFREQIDALSILPLVEKQAEKFPPEQAIVFSWPVISARRITSLYGDRILTYDGVAHKNFHEGIDLCGATPDIFAPEDLVIKKIVPHDKIKPCLFKWVDRKTGWIKETPPEGRKWNDGTWAWTPYITAVGVFTKNLYVFRHSVTSLKIGETVKVTYKVGNYGNYGYCMGAHLHFEMYPYSEELIKGSHWPKTIDPKKYFESTGIS